MVIAQIIYTHIKRTQLLPGTLNPPYYRMPIIMLYIIRYQTEERIFLFSSQTDSKHIGLIMNLVQHLLYFGFAFGRHVTTIV